MSILHAEIDHAPPPPPMSTNIIITSQMHCAKCIIPLQSAKKFFTWEALFMNKMMALSDYEIIQLFDEKYTVLYCVVYCFLLVVLQNKWNCKESYGYLVR